MIAVSPLPFIRLMSAPREMNNRIMSMLPSQAPIIRPEPMRLPMKSGARPASSQALA